MRQIPPLRKRGAQPGNRNAVKHGFYSTRLRPVEAADLDNVKTADLAGEIDLIRIHLRRLLEDAASSPVDIPERIEILRVICLASSSLTRLVRTQHIVFPDTGLMEYMKSLAAETQEELESGGAASQEHKFIGINADGSDDLS